MWYLVETIENITKNVTVILQDTKPPIRNSKNMVLVESFNSKYHAAYKLLNGWDDTDVTKKINGVNYNDEQLANLLIKWEREYAKSK